MTVGSVISINPRHSLEGTPIQSMWNVLIRARGKRRMNEARTIFRRCVVCGKDIEVKLSSKNHWWQKRKILGGGYHFFSGINLSRLRSRWSWHTKFLGLEESKSHVHQFLSDHVWWWSIPEAECSVPNWKKPYYMLRQWIEDSLDPGETTEYWECPECYHTSGETAK